MPKKILDTIVDVEGASGVIVFSSEEYTLVLTDYHVVSKLVDIQGNFINDKIRPTVSFFFVYKGESISTGEIGYGCEEIYVDEPTDLAILRINNGVKLNYSRLSVKNISVGKEVYIAANPNYNYRTIVKGIISNKDRYMRESSLWQISGGTVFGTSGGGAFSTDGKLVALARSIDAYDAGICCILPYIGYFTPHKVIRDFLLSTGFKDKFDYLK